jgi:putative Holliday junction resolvase
MYSDDYIHSIAGRHRVVSWKIMRIMALDLGGKRIGVAVSDSLLMTAQSRPTLQRRNLTADLERLRILAVENEVTEIVVGKPLHMSGDESPQSIQAARFAQTLSTALGLPVVLWDERLTSFAAEQELEEMGMGWRKRKQHVDQLAAMLILQGYLDSRSAKGK